MSVSCKLYQGKILQRSKRVIQAKCRQMSLLISLIIIGVATKNQSTQDLVSVIDNHIAASYRFTNLSENVCTTFQPFRRGLKKISTS